MSYTPGPWMTNGRAIEQREEPSLVIGYTEDEENDDWRDNARLIAAAPDMHRVCKDLRAELYKNKLDRQLDPDILGRLDAVISLVSVV